jgi:hypothetical protein
MISRRPDPFPLALPRLDGRTWPDRRAVGRAGFEVATLYEMGYREAFEPAANAIADLLLAELLPAIPLDDVPQADAPYLRRIFTVAAQVGAGIGIVEARTMAPQKWSSDPRIWGALWAALGDLPALPQQQRFAASYLMHSAYYLARTDDGKIAQLRAALRADLDPGGS